MNDIDRQIAERLGWRLIEGATSWELHRGDEITHIAYLHASEVVAWEKVLRRFADWSEDIGLALELVEELGWHITLSYWPDGKEWVACDFDDPKLAQTANTPAAAVARAILAWLEAKEAGR